MLFMFMFISCLFSKRFFINRITILIFIYSMLLFYFGYYPMKEYSMDMYNSFWIMSWISGMTMSSMLFIGMMFFMLLQELLGEKSLMMMLSIMGMMGMMCSNEMLLFILSMELLSYALAILACDDQLWESASSSGLKYFLLNALSSGLILLGCTLMYSNSGSWLLYHAFQISNTTYSLMIVYLGLLIKIGAAPFHFWMPDIYDGVPTMITSWMSIFPKLSLLFFMGSFSFLNLSSFILFSTYSCLFFGSFLGLMQYRIKSLLAYSSITHIGLMLITSLVSFESLIFYMMQYAFSSFCLFIILISFKYNMQTLSQLKGLSTIESMCFNINLLSLAGFPPFIGFFAKLLIFDQVLKLEFYFLLFFMIFTTVMGSVQYLSLINIISFTSMSEGFKNMRTFYNLNMPKTMLMSLTSGFNFSYYMSGSFSILSHFISFMMMIIIGAIWITPWQIFMI